MFRWGAAFELFVGDRSIPIAGWVDARAAGEFVNQVNAALGR